MHALQVAQNYFYLAYDLCYLKCQNKAFNGSLHAAIEVSDRKHNMHTSTFQLTMKKTWSN